MLIRYSEHTSFNSYEVKNTEVAFKVTVILSQAWRVLYQKLCIIFYAFLFGL